MTKTQKAKEDEGYYVSNVEKKPKTYSFKAQNIHIIPFCFAIRTKRLEKPFMKWICVFVQSENRAK